MIVYVLKFFWNVGGSAWQCCGKGERFRILKVWVRPWVAIFFPRRRASTPISYAESLRPGGHLRFTYSDSDPVTHKSVEEAKCKSRF